LLNNSEGDREPPSSLSVLDALAHNSVLLDDVGRIRHVNRAWRRFAQQNGAPSDYLGENYLEVCRRAAAAGDPDAAKVFSGLERILDGRSKTYRRVYTCNRRMYRVRLDRMPGTGDTSILVTHEDVSALAETRRVLRLTAQRLMVIEDDERRRLGADLHDSIGQHLFVLGQCVRAMERGDRGEETLAAMRHAVEETKRQVRTISYLLHPPAADLDLGASAQRLVRGFARRTDLNCRLELQGRFAKIEQEVRLTVIRVLQEALLNVHRHAGATEVNVMLGNGPRGLKLRVADNGRAASARSFTPGVGLTSMTSRLEALNGRLMITPTRRGTTLTALIPANGALLD
jgi:two-component system NarL family sensor kinase